MRKIPESAATGLRLTFYAVVVTMVSVLTTIALYRWRAFSLAQNGTTVLLPAYVYYPPRPRVPGQIKGNRV